MEITANDLELVITGLTAFAAVTAAIATFKTASASRQAGEVTRIAALLQTVPLLVPWVSADNGGVVVVNRGGTTSHNLRWKVVMGADELAGGSDQEVIAPLSEMAHRKGRTLALRPHQRIAIQEWAKDRNAALVVTCVYLASWGQQFTSVRTYPPHTKGSKIEIFDERGERLHLDSRS